MSVLTNRQEVWLNGTTSISVSDIEQDEDIGAYVRRIEFYTDATNATNRRPVLTVYVTGEEDSLKIQTPTLSF